MSTTLLGWQLHCHPRATGGGSTTAAPTRAIMLALAIAVLAGCNGREPASPVSSQPAVDATPPPPQEPSETVLKKAEKGVTGKGNYGPGIITTPLSAYFSARERIVFDIQIPENMNLFKAREGRAPRTQKEFMDEIIKAGMIHLPTLPEGHRYVYDPNTEQLMVEQPAPP